ncbi:MAG TPA: thiamine pyrophosphate-binding protein, partial [Candidatus Angelobacter sp.]|nr:thiamine pyrophosphate-binding protein [Candidatus Angelobacter sp.]
MPVAPHTPSSISQTSQPRQMSGAQAVIASLLRHGITAGFGIPSIHNIPLYDVLRQTPEFHHWIVRHEQAAGFAADGFHRRSGRIAVVFASTGPGNLFTLVPLLESFQTNTPVLLIGTNVASSLLAKTGGALHETPDQLEIIRPLTRFARRVASPAEITTAIDQAVAMFHSSMPGPAFIEIPHDLFHATVDLASSDGEAARKSVPAAFPGETESASRQITESRKPVILVGAGARPAAAEILQLAELVQCPVFTTTSGKGIFPGDHPLSLGCISRLGAVQDVILESDLLLSFGARLIEFDTGRFALKLPSPHLQVVADRAYPGDRIPSTLVIGDIAAIAQSFAKNISGRSAWCNIAEIKAQEAERLEALNQESYAALQLLRSS